MSDTEITPAGEDTGEDDDVGAVAGEEEVAADTREEVEADIGGTSGGRNRPGPIRRLYDWVLHWADTPYGERALFLIAFAESSFFPLPPDPLLLALCLGAPKRAFRFAAVSTAGSVLGGMLGYAIGAGAWSVAQDWFFVYVPGVTPEAFDGVRTFYDNYGFAAVFLAGLTPVPYKVFTLASGVFGINVGIFALASVLSRGLRFFLIGGLIHKFGPPVGRFIDRHFDRLVIVFGVLFVAGFLVLEFLL